MKRLLINLNGTVQGVGFRPFVYKIAKELVLKGYVLNDSKGVTIEVEGEEKELNEFLNKLKNEKPPLASIYYENYTYLPPIGYQEFYIKQSNEEGSKEVLILPDTATCNECLNELFEPNNRRYLYPFINCTNCGPRYTIIDSLPYDRPNTTMKYFKMCKECESEYTNPLDRRFHAQPNACSKCGPYVSLYSCKEKKIILEKGNALDKVKELIEQGNIIAVKGIGGFHLLCDATNTTAIKELRNRKNRLKKPFAVMFKNIEQIKKYGIVSEAEEELISTQQRPIVLIKSKNLLSSEVAPNLNTLGVFLPYSPLHYIILTNLTFPVIATSGNLSDEPIVKDNEEAIDKLSQFTDYILLHNRDINVRCDDSVLKLINNKPTFIRRARGYAPLPIKLNFKLKYRVLAVGGLLKNTFAIGFNDKVILSQHIGDIETLDALNYFDSAVKHLCKLYEFEPEVIIHDLHPEYETTKWAKRQTDIKTISVQHHFAHVLSCMAENGVNEEVLGISWDGTGLGDDGTLWGGEFLLCNYSKYKRIASFKPLKLIGGEKAIKQSNRVALAILYELFGKDALNLKLELFKTFTDTQLSNLYTIWQKGINCPFTSSVGRLFDAVSSILNINHINNYEGQSAMLLEELCDFSIKDNYNYSILHNQDKFIVDWSLIICDILEDKDREKVPSRFINTLNKIIVDIANKVNIRNICLSGGVFQNNYLTTRTYQSLTENGFIVYTQNNIPPNDGGLSLGQAVFNFKIN